MMMPGQKGRKSGAGLPAGGFLNLGPAKNMSKKPLFEEKIRGLGMFLELRECNARSNPVSEGTNTAAMGIILVAACFNKVHLQIWSATACANTALAR